MVIIKRRGGFTLAEVLITLSIIGVVAALTIPGLVVKNQEKERIVQLKKAYNVFSNAISLATTDYGTPDSWGWSYALDPDTGRPSSGVSSTKVLDILSNYLNLQRNCGTKKGCMPYSSGGLNDESVSSADDSDYGAKAILNDGMRIIIVSWSNDCKARWGTSEALKNGCGTLSVDLNGEKGPNRTGKDSFPFYITKYGFLPMGTPQETNNSLEKTCKNKTSNGNGCTAWVLQKENMDYLRGDISWD